jgi:hypothetical protein
MLGKSGDILSILPCLHAEFKETGIKPSLIVSNYYAALPRSIPWLAVEEFDGDFDFLGNALRWAKRRGPVDFIPQIHGIGYPKPKRNHPSFQLDQWDRMGRLHQWGTLPLEIERGRLIALIPSPNILFADHSQSSPFPHAEDLTAALKAEFPGHCVTRLSSVRLPLLTDFLALYDAADLLVTIDTAHLHLSAATKTSVIALATDNPSPWHGSAYHPRMALHVRYKDYELRKSELLWTARKCVAAKKDLT